MRTASSVPRPARLSCRLVPLVLVAGVLGGGVSAGAAAQVNIEAQRREPSDSGFSGTFAADLEVRTGNVEHFRLGAGGRLDYQARSSTTFLVGRGRIGLVGDNILGGKPELIEFSPTGRHLVAFAKGVLHIFALGEANANSEIQPEADASNP